MAGRSYHAHSRANEKSSTQRTAETFTSCLRRLVLQFVTLFLGVSLLTSSAAAGSPQGADEEYRIKAAFMYHFLQLVEWPAEAIGNNSAIVLCTIGDDPFQGGLEEAMNGKTARSRAIHVRHLKRSDDPHACHAIFLDGNDSKVTQQSIAALKNDPVLTVGDGDAFLQSGGMIRFIKEDNKVRFEINLRAAEQAKIRISSRLLLLAKTVIGKPGET